MPEQVPAVLKLKGGEQENSPNFPRKSDGDGAKPHRRGRRNSFHHSIYYGPPSRRPSNMRNVRNTFTAEKPSIPDNETKLQKSQGVRQSLSKFFRSLSSGSSIAKRVPTSGADMKSQGKY
ncbi:hypothetical protein MRX96_059650 [Rhipicephalus microplus]